MRVKFVLSISDGGEAAAEAVAAPATTEVAAGRRTANETLRSACRASRECSNGQQYANDALDWLSRWLQSMCRRLFFTKISEF